MTLSEFDLHRPILARQLRGVLAVEDFDGPWTPDEWSIVPRYEDDILFVASHPRIQTLVCVAPSHPMAMVDEEAPGSPTWWWESDLQAG